MFGKSAQTFRWKYLFSFDLQPLCYNINTKTAQSLDCEWTFAVSLFWNILHDLQNPPSASKLGLTQMEWEYGNRKTNTEGRNRVRQLWPGCHFHPPTLHRDVCWRRAGAERTQVLQKKTSLRRFSGAFKQISNRLTALTKEGRAGRGARMQIRRLCEWRDEPQPDRDAESQRLFTCRTSSQPKPQHSSTFLSFYAAFRSFVFPLLGALVQTSITSVQTP